MASDNPNATVPIGTSSGSPLAPNSTVPDLIDTTAKATKKTTTKAAATTSTKAPATVQETQYDTDSDIRKSYLNYDEDWLNSRVRVTYDEDGNRQVTPGPSSLVYDESSALGLMGNLKIYEGAVDELKRDLWWSGFYGSSKPTINGDMFDKSDLAALDSAMQAAEYQGGIDVVDMVDTMAKTGRERNAPLGQEVDPEDNPVTAFQDFAEKNGIKLSDDFIAKRIGAIGAGATTIEDELAKVRDKFVVNAFPAWKDEIMAGSSVEDLAAPYKASMAQILEIPESQIDLKDSTLRSALQSVDANGKATYKPLWLFEKELKQDERWQYTDNAYTTLTQASQSALNEMGFK